MLKTFHNILIYCFCPKLVYSLRILNFLGCNMVAATLCGCDELAMRLDYRCGIVHTLFKVMHTLYMVVLNWLTNINTLPVKLKCKCVCWTACLTLWSGVVSCIQHVQLLFYLWIRDAIKILLRDDEMTRRTTQGPFTCSYMQYNIPRKYYLGMELSTLILCYYSIQGEGKVECCYNKDILHLM